MVRPVATYRAAWRNAARTVSRGDAKKAAVNDPRLDFASYLLEAYAYMRSELVRNPSKNKKGKRYRAPGRVESIYSDPVVRGKVYDRRGKR